MSPRRPGLSPDPGSSARTVDALRGIYKVPWQLALQRWLESVAPGERSFTRTSRRGADREDIALPGRRREGWDGTTMKVMQELVAYFDRRGKLTRRQMRQLLEQGYLASDAPPTLLDLCDTAGDTYYFRVTGAVEGPLWGTDVYTGDSALGVVAVHAGVLRAGETAVVRVTVEVPLPKYVGSVRNGVTSHDFGSFGTAYRVQPISARCAPASSPGG